MSARKRWRLVWSPGGSTEQMSSSVRAYQIVKEERERIKDGRSDTTSVSVQVDAADGFGWQTYEQIDFRSGASR